MHLATTVSVLAQVYPWIIENQLPILAGNEPNTIPDQKLMTLSLSGVSR